MPDLFTVLFMIAMLLCCLLLCNLIGDFYSKTGHVLPFWGVHECLLLNN